MRLFEYADNFADLFDSFDAIAEFEPQINENGEYIDDDGNIITDLADFKKSMLQAWYDTLDGIEEGFEEKAENIACCLKQLSGELEMLKGQKQAFERRRKAKENQIESLKDYLVRCMDKIGRTKIETSRAKITLKANAESVDIIDEKEFIKWAEKNAPQYLRFKPEINKTKIKSDLQSGENIPLADLVKNKSLLIK